MAGSAAELSDSAHGGGAANAVMAKLAATDADTAAAAAAALSPDMPKKFALPVDSENKAKQLRILSLARPHMLCFHLNWCAYGMHAR